MIENIDMKMKNHHMLNVEFKIKEHEATNLNQQMK